MHVSPLTTATASHRGSSGGRRLLRKEACSLGVVDAVEKGAREGLVLLRRLSSSIALPRQSGQVKIAQWVVLKFIFVSIFVQAIAAVPVGEAVCAAGCRRPGLLACLAADLGQAGTACGPRLVAVFAHEVGPCMRHECLPHALQALFLGCSCLLLLFFFNHPRFSIGARVRARECREVSVVVVVEEINKLPAVARVEIEDLLGRACRGSRRGAWAIVVQRRGRLERAQGWGKRNDEADGEVEAREAEVALLEGSQQLLVLAVRLRRGVACVSSRR